MRRDYTILLSLAAPILVGQLGTIATGFADNIMVGRYSTEALASASFCNNVFNMTYLACMGFTMGITPLVGALYGRGRSAEEQTGTLMAGAVVLNAVFAVALTAIMTVVYAFIGDMGQPGELLPLMRPYFILNILGIIPVAAFNVFAQWSYGINNTRTPMWIILGGNILNVLGNFMLIYGELGAPELGLTGAGISTLVSRLLTAAAICLFFMRSRLGARYLPGFRLRRVDRALLRRIWRTSIPVALQMSFETAAFSGCAVFAGMLGKIPLAAFQIVIITGTLGFCVYYSLGAAISVRVANGASRDDAPHAMRSTARAGYILMLGLMAAASLTFALFGRPIMHIFTDDPAVLVCATSLIFPMVLYQLGDATQITFANALRGTSRVMPMLWIAFFSYIVLGLPSSWLLAFTAGMGVYGLVLSFSVSLFTAAALFLTFFLRATRPVCRQKDVSL